MKTTLILITLALASCSAPTEWADTPNPLDTPATEYRTPPSEGHFGHGWQWR
jgi:hypothetical protein